MGEKTAVCFLYLVFVEQRSSGATVAVGGLGQSMECMESIKYFEVRIYVSILQFNSLIHFTLLKVQKLGNALLR